MTAESIRIQKTQNKDIGFKRMMDKLSVEDNIFSLNDINNTSRHNDDDIKFNQRQKIDGLKLLNTIKDDFVKVCFFDPQYRGILDKMNYGNEGKSKEKRRCNLIQMDEKTIMNFLLEINRVLMPSSYLFLWIDKFHLCNGVSDWFNKTSLQIVDLIVWEKSNIGMGYRTRNKSEFLLVLQKKPVIAKKTWTIHNIPNVWKEKVDTKEHPHTKPIELQKILIQATSQEGDIILDPAMGSGSVLKACLDINRNFIGGDIDG